MVQICTIGTVIVAETNFSTCAFSDGGSERGAIMFSNAPILFNNSLIYKLFSGEAKAVCIDNPSHKTNIQFAYSKQ